MQESTLNSNADKVNCIMTDVFASRGFALGAQRAPTIAVTANPSAGTRSALFRRLVASRHQPPCQDGMMPLLQPELPEKERGTRTCRICSGCGRSRAHRARGGRRAVGALAGCQPRCPRSRSAVRWPAGSERRPDVEPPESTRIRVPCRATPDRLRHRAVRVRPCRAGAFDAGPSREDAGGTAPPEPARFIC